MPRFLVDMIASRRFVNYPQVEDLTLDDANEISYPIILRIYAILHEPNKPNLRYMTRVLRYARFYYKKFDADQIPEVKFDYKKQRNLEEFLHIFADFPNRDQIFNSIKEAPDQLKLFLLAIIYWMTKSKLTTSIYLQSILLGLIAIYNIDRKFQVTHDEEKYQKCYTKLLQDYKKNSVQAQSSERSFIEIIRAFTKQESILAMEKQITNFSVNKKFERKHADFNRQIVHVFSELQSVCYFFYTLNSICGYPFEQLKMGQLFNGLFLYNTFVSLKSRTDIQSFIREHIFKYAPNFLEFYEKLFDLCKDLMPNLENLDKQRIKVKPVKILPDKSSSIAKDRQQIRKKYLDNDCSLEKKDSDNDEQEEFNDINNKFSELLKF